MAQKQLLTVSEVAKLLGYNPGSVYRLVETGVIESVIVGLSSVRIPRSAYQAFVKSRTQVRPRRHK